MATLTLRPDSDIVTTGWVSTPLYSKVNEVTADDGATEVQASSLATARLGLPNHTTEEGTINSVTVYVRGKVTHLGGECNGWFRCGLRINGTNYDCGTNHHILNTYTNYSRQWTVSPNSGVAFTWAEIDGMEMLLVGEAVTDGKGAWCIPFITQAYVVVDYTPPTATFQPRSLAVGVDQRY